MEFASFHKYALWRRARRKHDILLVITFDEDDAANGERNHAGPSDANATSSTFTFFRNLGATDITMCVESVSNLAYFSTVERTVPSRKRVVSASPTFTVAADEITVPSGRIVMVNPLSRIDSGASTRNNLTTPSRRPRC